MNKKTQLLTTLLSSLVCLSAQAEEEKKLTTSLEFGWIQTSGNTETTSTKGSADITHNTDNWKHNYTLNLFNSSTVDQDEDVGSPDRKDTVKKFGATMKNTFKLDSKHSGLFILTTYDDASDSGYDYQAAIAAGYANRLFETPKSNFDYSIGPGYSINKPLIETEEDDDSFIVRIDLKYVYRFSENAKFVQKLSSDVAGDSDKNSKIRSESSVQANINNSLALKVALTVDRNSLVPEEFEKTDTQSSITLVYSF